MKYFILCSATIFSFISSIASHACQDLDAKALKNFKDKTGVDLKQPLQLNFSSQMTTPAELANQWDQQQRKKWQLLLPTTKTSEIKITDYRIFSCSANMQSYYPCTKTLYQLRIQLNPKESCNRIQGDKMNIAVLAIAENKTLKILDMLYETNPSSHQMTPLGLIVLEDIELTKKEFSKLN